MPVAIETSGVLDNDAEEFLQQIGHRCTKMTSDPNETSYVFQQILIVIQKGNVIAFHGTFAEKFLTNNFAALC